MALAGGWRDTKRVTVYRRDIDGLRAVAIIPVVLCHYGVGVLPGGYVGVDIFFVLSGFLITSILTDEIEAKRFSLLGFYERRFRRILPALFAVILTVAAAGIVLLPPRPLEALAKSLVATVAFSSNMYFWVTNASYFASPAETQPLLHTWSLAVEEQFYLAFPILLAAIFRWGRRAAGWTIALLACASFALSIWGSANAPTPNFYSAPTRAWELFLGAALALHLTVASGQNHRFAGSASICGMSLIAYAVTAFGPATAMPGLPALLPCAGAALLIYGGQSPSGLVTRLLSTRLLVGIGLISYALYLWHWPIYVFLRHYVLLTPLQPLQVLAALALSVAAATMSWRFVEQPIRSRTILASRRSVFLASVLASGLLLGIGTVGIVAKGFPARFRNLGAAEMQAEPPFSNQPESKQCFNLDPTRWGGKACQLVPVKPQGRRVLLWGDSFANHYAQGFLANRDTLPFGVLQYTAPRCPPVLNYNQLSNRTCNAFNQRVMTIITDFHIDTVIMSARWDRYLLNRKLTTAEIGPTIRALQERGVGVVLVGQSPTFYFENPVDFLLIQLRSGHAVLTANTARATAGFDPGTNSRLRDAAAGATFFDPTTVFCRKTSCLFRESGLYIVSDSGHLTRHGGERIVERLLQLPALQGGSPACLRAGGCAN